MSAKPLPQPKIPTSTKRKSRGLIKVASLGLAGLIAGLLSA